MERYMAAAEAYEKQLEDLRCADAEDYNLLKVRYRVNHLHPVVPVLHADIALMLKITTC